MSGSSTCVLCIVILLMLSVVLPLAIIYGPYSTKRPTFTAESTAVKAYNLTSDNSLFCIINIGFRVYNPNRKRPSFDFSAVDLEVRKGRHHKLADDALGRFRLAPRGGARVDVEAVGLRVGLKRKIAEEVRADVAAGEGRVNVFMFGSFGNWYYLRVKCKNLVVDFSRLTATVHQEVDCEASFLFQKD